MAGELARSHLHVGSEAEGHARCSPDDGCCGCETDRESPMRIVVDLNRCQGYAQCVFLAHEVFRLKGEEALTYDANPDDARRLQVQRAAAACPVQAIVVDRLDGAERSVTS